MYGKHFFIRQVQSAIKAIDEDTKNVENTVAYITGLKDGFLVGSKSNEERDSVRGSYEVFMIAAIDPNISRRNKFREIIQELNLIY